MEKLQKLAVVLSIALGVGGGAFALFASTNPTFLMSNPGITGLMPGFFIVLMAVIMLAAFSPLIKNAVDNAGKKKRLMQIGVKAVATIVGVQDTGISVNNNPFIKMEVEIKPGVHALISATVSRVAIPRAGDQVSIIYDPSKPSDAIIAP